MLDADILTYRCGFATEKKRFVVCLPDGKTEVPLDTRKQAQELVLRAGGYIKHEVFVEPLENALHNVNTVIQAIQEKYPEATLLVFLSGKDNYRYKLATIKPYKGNRSPFAKPTHYAGIRKHLQNVYDATVVDGIEADDAIGVSMMELAKEGLSPICVSTDKDLDMIPGTHYNWVNKEQYEIDGTEAYRNFFRQCLTGDPVDNVPGIENVGPVTARKILADCGRPSSMLHAVRQAWRDYYPDGVTRHDGSKLHAEAALLEVGQLLWIKRDKEDRLWDFDSIKD